MAIILDLEEVAGWKEQVRDHLMYKWYTRVAIMTLAGNLQMLIRESGSCIYLFHYNGIGMCSCNNCC